MIQYQNTYLTKLDHKIPERSVSNDELIQKNSLKISSAWIEKRLGITTRRWAADDQTTSDLAVNVLKKISKGEAPLFFSTISPDYLTPSTSSEIKRKMSWKENSFAIDMNAACAGFIFCLEMAATYLKGSGQKKAYCVAAEIRSRFLNLNDRRTVFLFADASAGCLIETEKDNAIAELLWTQLLTESLVEPEILVPGGGAKTPMTVEGVNENLHKITMVDGGNITQSVETKLVSTIKESLEVLKEDVSSYDFFIFHQGNAQLIREVLKQLNLDENRTHINFDTYGNSSSASAAVALSEAHALGKIKKGQKVLMIAMGAGNHLGIAGLKWH